MTPPQPPLKARLQKNLSSTSTIRWKLTFSQQRLLCFWWWCARLPSVARIRTTPFSSAYAPPTASPTGLYSNPFLVRQTSRTFSKASPGETPTSDSTSPRYSNTSGWSKATGLRIMSWLRRSGRDMKLSNRQRRPLDRSLIRWGLASFRRKQSGRTKW